MQFEEKDLKTKVYYFYLKDKIIDKIHANNSAEAKYNFNKMHLQQKYDFILEIDKKFNYKKTYYSKGKNSSKEQGKQKQ